MAFDLERGFNFDVAGGGEEGGWDEGCVGLGTLCKDLPEYAIGVMNKMMKGGDVQPNQPRLLPPCAF